MGLCGCVENSSFYLSNLALQRVRSRIVTHERLAADKFAHHRNQKSANTPFRTHAHTYPFLWRPKATRVHARFFVYVQAKQVTIHGCAGVQRPQFRMEEGRRCRPRTPGILLLPFSLGRLLWDFGGGTNACTHEGARVLYANIRPCSWLSAWVPLSVCDPERVRMYAAVVRAGGSQRHHNWREDGSVGGPAQNSSQPKTRR